MNWYEWYYSCSLRQKALDRIYEHVCADDDFTHCISIGPVWRDCIIILIQLIINVASILIDAASVFVF